MNKSKYMKNILNKKSIILLILLVVFLFLAIYFYQKTSKVEDVATNETEAVELIASVGKLIVLPEGEVPTIATVSDPEELKDQPFFVKAKVGDKVILYPQSRKAFLYDPTANKILEVAPINLESGN